MPKKGRKTKKIIPGNPDDPNGFVALSEMFLEWMKIKNYSDQTIANRRNYVIYFVRWCEERGLAQPREITIPIVERYQRYLHYYRKKDGDPLSIRSQHLRLTSIRSYFKWLAKNNLILYNPVADIDLPRLEHRLPKHVLTEREIETVINQPDIGEPLGIRDRAILEVLYSTGIRRMEVINLKLHDVDEDRGTLMVRLGKGKKDRMVPVGERALAWVRKYVHDVRPDLVVDPDDGTLFLTTYAEAFTRNRMTQLVRDYMDAADIRFIQQMLGHARLDTTQVSIRMLKEIHSLTHPTAKLTRKKTTTE